MVNTVFTYCNNIGYVVNLDTYESTKITDLTPDQLALYSDIISSDITIVNALFEEVIDRTFLVSGVYNGKSVGLYSGNCWIKSLLEFKCDSWIISIEKLNSGELNNNYCIENKFSKCGDYYVIDCIREKVRYAYSDKYNQTLKIPFKVLRL